METRTTDQPNYVRRERDGGLPFLTKLFQGVGAIPDTVKNWVFNTFVLLYYNQLLGMDAVLVSVALAIAVVFDAVIDPLVASLSDNLHTKWGRRHPLMLIASVPMGLSLFAVFVPPAGLGDGGLFVWLLVSAICTRGFMSLYFVPWAAIAAELSDDYDERTSVMSYRFAVGWSIGIGFPLFVFNFVMPNTAAYHIGQLNPHAYPVMALYGGLLLTCGSLATTLLTWREIPYLRQHAEAPARFGLAQSVRDLWRSLQNRQFALVFLIVFLSSAIGGTTANIGIYMTTFFWGLTSKDLRWYALVSIGAIIAFPLVALVQKRWDKKYILLVCSSVGLVEGLLLVNLRFLGVLPENGDPRLLVILISVATFGAGVAVIQGIIGASVVADVLDDHELRTGYRQEAMFNAALSFSGKAVSGIGIILGGVIIKSINFPTGVAPSAVPPEKIFHLGLVVGVLVPMLYVIPISLITRYRITREEHERIRAALATKRGGGPTRPIVP